MKRFRIKQSMFRPDHFVIVDQGGKTPGRMVPLYFSSIENCMNWLIRRDEAARLATLRAI